MKICDGCKKELPTNKFNPESFSPNHCFSCRVGTINVGFGGYRKAFGSGEGLYGGTIASDVRHTVESARAQGHDPVPAGYSAGHGLSGTQTAKLKKALDSKFG